MWAAVRKETGGRVEAQVFPLNNNVQGSDPAALKLLVAGEIQFFTLMGGLLSAVVPVADVQQVPFAFQRRRTRTGPWTARSAPTFARRWPRRAFTAFPSALSTTACGR